MDSAARSAGPVEVCGWEEFGVSVSGVDADLPLVLVDEAVVVAAEKDCVVEGGCSAVGPVADVVAVAPAGWSVAAGEGAAPVAQNEGAADGAGEQASLPAEVEDLSVAAQHCGQDPSVAGQPPRGTRRKLSAIIQLRHSGQLSGSGWLGCSGCVAALSESSTRRVRRSAQTARPARSGGPA